MEIVTLREFARRVGVSLTAIQKGVKSGRIQAITDPDTKKITGIDFATQATAWTANSKHPQKLPNTIAGGRPRHDGQPTAAPATKSIAANADSAQAEPEKPGMSLADIQRARELVKLQIDNEKLKEVRGQSVATTDVEKQGRSLAAIIISGMYTIPDRISDELAGMTDANAIQNLLLQEIDRAVEQLRKAYAPA